MRTSNQEEKIAKNISMFLFLLFVEKIKYNGMKEICYLWKAKQIENTE